MKIVTVLLLGIVAVMCYAQGVAAQEDGSAIIATTYETRDDIDFLFQNSTRVLEYLEGEDIETPTFLSVVSSDQLETIEDAGYEVRVLDATNDLSRFVLLYNPLPDQAEKLQSFGEPIVVSRHYTLLKMPEGEEFSHEGEAVKFFDIPFSTMISPPPFRTKTVTADVVDEASSRGLSAGLIIGGVVVGVLLAASAIFFIVRMRQPKIVQ